MRARRGTTLIEAMIAVAVLATGVAGVAAAMIATAGQDRRNAGRAAAMTVATDTAQALARLKFADPLLNTVVYAGAGFGGPKVASATQVPGVPPAANDVWVGGAPPTYNEANAAVVPGLRSQAELNTNYPGKLYVFNRYWNVMVDPNNAFFKVVAVHVTYNSGTRTRAVVSVYTSVFDEQSLTNALSN